MKALKDVKEFELVYLVPAAMETYSITPMVLCQKTPSRMRINDSQTAKEMIILPVSTGKEIIYLFVSRKLYYNGESNLRVLRASSLDYIDYFVYSDEDEAKLHILRHIDIQEKLAKDDIDKFRDLIRGRKKLIVDLKKKRKEFSL